MTSGSEREGRQLPRAQGWVALGTYQWYTARVQQTNAKQIAATAKVFKTGRSQAVRLPKAYQFDVPEVFIRRDESTGEVILSTTAPSPTWAEFFAAVANLTQEERDQLPERRVIVTKKRNPAF